MLKRKQARDSFNEARHKEKMNTLREKREKQKPSKWVRRSEGAWIIKNKIRVSKVGLILLCVITGLAIFLYLSTLPQFAHAQVITADDEKKQVDIAKENVKVAEKRLKDIDIDVNELHAKNAELEINILKLENDVKKLRDKKNDAYTEYRHSLDLKPTPANLEAVKKTQANAKKEYDIESTKYDKKLVELDKAKKELASNYRKIKELNIEKNNLSAQLKLLYYPDLDNAKIKLSLKTKPVKYISVILSESCAKSKCMKYSDLLDIDTTIPEVSGKFVEKDGDVRREKSPLREYWHYYNQSPQLKVVTVDPDSNMISISSVIEVVPPNVVFLSNSFTIDKNKSLNNLEHERYEWRDVRVYDKCTKAMVVPDKEVIKKTISFMMEGCQGESISTQKTIKLKVTPYSVKDSPHYQELRKWDNAAKACRQKCL